MLPFFIRWRVTIALLSATVGAEVILIVRSFGA